MKPPTEMRLDQALTELGLAPSRTKAQQLIEAGDVEIFVRSEWKQATQSSFLILQSKELIRLKNNPDILKFVSRGGLKMEGALEHVGLDVKGFRCLDLGISTGGFTNCLLFCGAAAICGVDVGHGQLYPSLQTDPRLEHFERMNVKDIPQHPKIRAWIKQGVDLCVADLSFISLLSVVPVIREFLPEGTKILALIKPQFELGAAALNKAGVVTDTSLFKGLAEKTLAAFPGGQFFPSSIIGLEGNAEFFLYATL